jgi:hypothetical protein
LDAEVLPYHWDDPEKYRKDYIYVDVVYEKYLNQLTRELNVPYPGANKYVSNAIPGDTCHDQPWQALGRPGDKSFLVKRKKISRIRTT